MSQDKQVVMTKLAGLRKDADAERLARQFKSAADKQDGRDLGRLIRLWRPALLRFGR